MPPNDCLTDPVDNHPTWTSWPKNGDFYQTHWDSDNFFQT